ncbi:hypothetical protein [Nonlabens sp.]|uniref:hypothetical protein n=1 Tax=Nonlabens sp. TaxID=1888209 RepID=UPI003F6A51B9
MLAVLAFCVGVLFYYDFSKPNTRLTLNSSVSNVLKFSFSGNTDLLNTMTHIIFMVIILCCALSYGLEIFYRDDYIPTGNLIFVTVMKLASMVLTILLGLIYNQNRWLSFSYFLIIFMIALGTGSRLAAVYIVLYSLLIFLTGKSTLKNKLIFGLNIVLTFLFVCFLISLRPLEYHGLIPYVTSLIVTPEAFLDTIAFNFYYSFIFGIFVTAETITENAVDWNNIYVSVNPLPGKWIGWYDVAPKLRSNIHAPFSFNGEIFTFGKAFTIFFFIILGIVFSDLEYRMRWFFKHKKKLLGFLIAFLMALFILFSFEYNMRSTIRYIYYAYITILIHKMMNNYKFKLSSLVDVTK